MAKKITFDDVRSFYRVNGCELLEEVFVHSHAPMRFRCSCGGEHCKTYSNFRQSSRCRECGDKSRFDKSRRSFDDVTKMLEEAGFEWVGGTYCNNNKPLKCKCKKGHTVYIRLSNIQGGQGCKHCGVENRSGSKHYKWKNDREEVDERRSFRSRCYNMLKSTLISTGKKKNTKTKKLLGYDPESLRLHIKSHRNWEKVKNQKWHIDHIFPVDAFLDYGITDVTLINCLDNLQPLTMNENLKKSNSYDQGAFEDWLKARDIKTDCL